MKLIKQAGGIVRNPAGDVLLVRSLAKRWTFPKGAIEDESPLETARREITEETGVTDLRLRRELGEFERPGFTRQNLTTPSVLKRVRMYLFETNQTLLHVDDAGTLDAAWVPTAEVLERLSHRQEQHFFAELLRTKRLQ